MVEEEFRTRAYYAGAFALPSLQICPSATAFGTQNRQKQAIFYTQEVFGLPATSYLSTSSPSIDVSQRFSIESKYRKSCEDCFEVDAWEISIATSWQALCSSNTRTCHARFQILTSACLDLWQTCRLIKQFNNTSTLALALFVSACSLQQTLVNVLPNVLLQDNGNDQVMHAKSLCLLHNGTVHDALSDLAQQGLV